MVANGRVLMPDLEELICGVGKHSPCLVLTLGTESRPVPDDLRGLDGSWFNCSQQSEVFGVFFFHIDLQTPHHSSRVVDLHAGLTSN